MRKYYQGPWGICDGWPGFIVARVDSRIDDTGVTADWSAYVGGAPMLPFKEQLQFVAEHGQKLPKNVAEVVFGPGTSSDLRMDIYLE